MEAILRIIGCLNTSMSKPKTTKQNQIKARTDDLFKEVMLEYPVPDSQVMDMDTSSSPSTSSSQKSVITTSSTLPVTTASTVITTTTSSITTTTCTITSASIVTSKCLTLPIVMDIPPSSPSSVNTNTEIDMDISPTVTTATTSSSTPSTTDVLISIFKGTSLPIDTSLSLTSQTNSSMGVVILPPSPPPNQNKLNSKSPNSFPSDYHKDYRVNKSQLYNQDYQQAHQQQQRQNQQFHSHIPYQSQYHHSNWNSNRSNQHSRQDNRQDYRHDNRHFDNRNNHQNQRDNGRPRNSNRSPERYHNNDDYDDSRNENRLRSLEHRGGHNRTSHFPQDFDYSMGDTYHHDDVRSEMFEIQEEEEDYTNSYTCYEQPPLNTSKSLSPSDTTLTKNNGSKPNHHFLQSNNDKPESIITNEKPSSQVGKKGTHRYETRSSTKSTSTDTFTVKSTSVRHPVTPPPPPQNPSISSQSLNNSQIDDIDDNYVNQDTTTVDDSIKNYPVTPPYPKPLAYLNPGSTEHSILPTPPPSSNELKRAYLEEFFQDKQEQASSSSSSNKRTRLDFNVLDPSLMDVITSPTAEFSDVMNFISVQRSLLEAVENEMIHSPLDIIYEKLNAILTSKQYTSLKSLIDISPIKGGVCCSICNDNYDINLINEWVYNHKDMKNDRNYHYKKSCPQTTKYILSCITCGKMTCYRCILDILQSNPNFLSSSQTYCLSCHMLHEYVNSSTYDDT